MRPGAIPGKAGSFKIVVHYWTTGGSSWLPKLIPVLFASLNCRSSVLGNGRKRPMKDYSVADGKPYRLDNLHVHGSTVIVQDGVYSGHRTWETEPA